MAEESPSEESPPLSSPWRRILGVVKRLEAKLGVREADR